MEWGKPVRSCLVAQAGGKGGLDGARLLKMEKQTENTF